MKAYILIILLITPTGNVEKHETAKTYVECQTKMINEIKRQRDTGESSILYCKEVDASEV